MLDAVGYTTNIVGGTLTVYDEVGNVAFTGTKRQSLYYLDDEYADILYGGRQSFTITERVVPPDEGENSGVKSMDCNTDYDQVTQDSNTFNNKGPGGPIDLDNGYHSGGGEALPAVRNRSTTVGLTPLEQLHREWGHLSEKYMKRALKESMVKGCRYKYEDIKDQTLRVCDPCMRGRMKATNKRKGTERVHQYKPFEKIGVDYKGPFAIRSYHHYNGFIALSDFASNYCHVEFVKSKTEALIALDRFNKSVIKSKGKQWRVMQSDWDSIFKSQEVRDWLLDNGISLQLSAPYLHSENGQIERDIQSIMDKARTLMAVYNAPPQMWEFAVKMACYLLNRSPHAGNLVTPEEALTGETPDISNLIPFYAPGLYHLTREERKGTLSYKAEPCRMLGYSEDSFDTYVVLRLRDRKLMHRGDCIFDESAIAKELEDARILDPYYTDLQELDEIGEDAESDDEDIIEPLFTRIPVPDRRQGQPIGERLKDLDESGEEYSDEDVTGREDEFIPAEPEEHPYWKPEPSATEYEINYNLSIAAWMEDAAYNMADVQPLPPSPKTIAEAMTLPDADEWRAAIEKELSSFETYESFGPAASPTGRGMKMKLVLKYTYNPDYSLKRKARLVVCGYSQIKGLEYNETYAPTTDVALVFFILCLGIMTSSVVKFFDIGSAYLEGRSDIEELYAWLPAELSVENKPTRIKLNGNIYGTKQAGKVWNDKFNAVLRSIGLIRCPVTPCLYARFNGDDYVFITMHVDDCLVIASNDEIIDELMCELRKHIRRVTLSDDFSRYLGMDLTYIPNSNYVLVSQEVYIEAKFSDYRHTTLTPMEAGLNLRKELPNEANASLLPVTGALRYVADRCRPDILVSVGETSSGGTPHPSDAHVKNGERCRHYLSTTKQLGLLFGGPAEFHMFGYCDASYIADGNAKSRLGGCLFMSAYTGAFYSYSKNDTSISTISHSSAEAEVKSLDELAREVVHRREVAQFCRCKVEGPTPLYIDNQAAIRVCTSLKTGHKLKHINMRLHYLRELINTGVIVLYFVGTDDNVADILTKPLSRAQFEKLRKILMEGHGGTLPELIQLVNYIHYTGFAAEDSAEETI